MYQALYREYRPMKLADSVGQDGIVTILKNQIMNNQTSHAYLFTGVRGTGKTSFAKILARAVNCLDQKDGEPCNKCENCEAILTNDTTDVIEMDAASNTSVDDIRKIIEEMYFVPAKLKYRVYIIDEAHMLSNSAWNAFLKSLEEPPKHVKFILATTEPQKLLPTILSRCQRFDFKRIDENIIYKYLKNIVKKSKINIEDDALKLIANLADGSMRDGISIVESIRSIDGEISVQDIREVIGIPSFDDVILLIQNILKQEDEEVLSIAHKLINEGKEANNILVEMLKVLEDMVISTKESLSKYSKSEKVLINEIIEMKEIKLYELIRDIAKIYADLKYSSSKNTVFIASMLALSANNYLGTINKVQNVESAEVFPKTVEKSEKADDRIPVTKEEQKEIVKEIKKQKDEELKSQASVPISKKTNNIDWPSVLQYLLKHEDKRLFVLLSQAKSQILDDVLEVKIYRKLTDDEKEYLETENSKNNLSQAIYEVVGEEYKIKFIYKEED